jgi:MoaA/NifB/PqqE/SkfB family radical SAM enzyme
MFSTLAKQGRFGGNMQMSLLSGQLGRMGIEHELVALVMRPGDEEQNRATVDEFVELMERWRPEHVVLYALWLPWLADALRTRTGARVMTLDPAQPGDIPSGLAKLNPQSAVIAMLRGAKTMRAARKILKESDPVASFTPSFGYRFLGTDEPVMQDMAFVSLLSCPYDAPIETNPAFRGLAMDGDVSARGCSYCNAARDYKPMAGTEKQRLLEHQIRYLADHLPGLEEIALPFPEDYLAPLARVLRSARRAGIRPIVLSGQFRLESVLENEHDLDDLLSAAEESGFEFHMNVVGVESFLDRDLELFNRGTARGVRAALEALGRLRERHDPATFMPTTTGSFILFHPWQTLAGLRSNLEAMRESGVAGLFHTININDIRFHPGVALYHLARRDGLLAPVRKAVQDVPLGGYFAETPWRFRHEDTSEVHRLFSRMSSRTEDRIGLLEACVGQVEERPRSRPDPGEVAGGLDRLTDMVRQEPLPGGPRLLIGIGSRSNVGYPRSLYDGRRFPDRIEPALARIEAIESPARTRVTVGGPEPTMARWLPELLDRIKESGVGEVELLTYGRMLTYPWYVARIAGSGADLVTVILHHPEPTGHDAAVRVEGAFVQATAGLRALSDLGRLTAVAAVMGPENRGRSGDMARLARGLGCAELRLVLPLGNLDLDALDETEREARETVQLGRSLEMRTGFDVELSLRWSREGSVDCEEGGDRPAERVGQGRAGRQEG